MSLKIIYSQDFVDLVIGEYKGRADVAKMLSDGEPIVGAVIRADSLRMLSPEYVLGSLSKDPSAGLLRAELERIVRLKLLYEMWKAIPGKPAH